MASEQPTSLSPQNIKLKGQLQAVGAVPFFEKCLTSSDTGAHGRVVLPKVRASLPCEPPVHWHVRMDTL